MFYFSTYEQDWYFNTFAEARKEAETQGILKIRHTNGDEYYL